MTSKNFQGKNTQGQLMFFPVDSRAKHFRLQEQEQQTLLSGRKCLEQIQRLNRLSLWQRMFLESLVERTEWRSTLYVLTWKLRATKCNRLIFRLRAKVLPTNGNGYGSLLTPTSSDAIMSKKKQRQIVSDKKRDHKIEKQSGEMQQCGIGESDSGIGNTDTQGLRKPLHNKESSKGIQQESLQRYRISEQETFRSISNTPNPNSKRLQGQRKHRGQLHTEPNKEREINRTFNENQFQREWVEVATELCRVDDGLPAELGKGERTTIYKAIKYFGREEVERTLGINLMEVNPWRKEEIMAYGNSIVPQVAFEIFRGIEMVCKSSI